MGFGGLKVDGARKTLFFGIFTPLKTNIFSEIWWLEDDFFFENGPFSGVMLGVSLPGEMIQFDEHVFRARILNIRNTSVCSNFKFEVTKTELLLAHCP